MANTEHVDLLKKSVKNWNKLPIAGGTSGRFDGEPIGLDLVAEPPAETPARVRIFTNPTARRGPYHQTYYLVVGSLKES